MVEFNLSNCAFCNSSKVSYEDFKNPLSRKEFRISGLCQDCQDKTFGEDKDEI